VSRKSGNYYHFGGGEGAVTRFLKMTFLSFLEVVSMVLSLPGVLPYCVVDVIW